MTFDSSFMSNDLSTNESLRSVSLWDLIKQARDELSQGFQFVSNNYIDLHIQVSIMTWIAFILMSSFQDFLASEHGVVYLKSMVKGIKCIGTGTQIVNFVPENMALRDLTMYLYRVLRTKIGLRPLLLIAQNVVLVPIAEEMVYRWFLSDVKHKIWGQTIVDHENNDENVSKTQKAERLIQSFWTKPILWGLSPWQMAAHALFGLSHFQQYSDILGTLSLDAPCTQSSALIPMSLDHKIVQFTRLVSRPKSVYEEEKNRRLQRMIVACDRAEAVTVVVRSIAHVFVASFLSLSLERVYEKSGLLAAIGAHATWNFYSLFEHIMWPLYMGYHGYKSLCRRVQKQRRQHRLLNVGRGKEKSCAKWTEEDGKTECDTECFSYNTTNDDEELEGVHKTVDEDDDSEGEENSSFYS